MKKLRYIGAIGALVAGSLSFSANPVEASHTYCGPVDSGDALSRWLPGCRNVIYDAGYDKLMTRAELWSQRDLYTSSVANFSENFLWYSVERDVKVDDPSVKWTSCDPKELPGTGGSCAVNLIESDYNGAQPHSGAHDGFLLSAYDNAPQITLSMFEFDGMWIAKACGNWLDKPNRPKPVPYINGYKFRDDDRSGTWDASARERPLAGWTIKLTRLSSEVGQAPNQTWTDVTDSNGYYRFGLDGIGPGRYRVEEIPQADWENYTPISYDVDVGWGGGDREYRYDFGNAETTVDVGKQSMTVIDPPDHIEVNRPTDITVRVEIANLGPADRVRVRDVLVARPREADCTVLPAQRSFDADLRRGSPVTRDLTFTVLCTKPSEHHFDFDDELRVLTAGVTDINPTNDAATIGLTRAVHAETDFGVTATLDCAPQTDVGVTAPCDAVATVTSVGYGPADATVALRLALPDDCVADDAMVMLAADGLVPGVAIDLPHTFQVTCSHRSFHDFEVSAAVTPVDPHVFDTNPTNDSAGDGPDVMEVFHDAAMQVDDVHLTCDEVLGAATFTCTADVTYSKPGPAADVAVVLSAKLAWSDECAATDSREREQRFRLDGGDQQTRSFAWTLSCPESDVLHPFEVTTDIVPDVALEPHAVDEPAPATDVWVVPYCRPTVNPHGKREPQAPGTGQNEDGFYVFGTLPDDLGEEVFIRDDESGVVFGPFPNGTRIKWVEANGARPTISAMGGNNGKERGQAVAVDYQIRARGDAQAFYVDEKGVEVSVTCLVPPFPK